MSSSLRLLIIGLDCAEPSLVFERWQSELPNLSRLRQRGSYGRMESCIPAITVPAWSCMMSGHDPGELGIYGFRNRADRGYQQMTVANSNAVRFPRLWDLLGEQGWRVAVIGVPGTYPPRPVNGTLVSCFLAPSPEVTYTYPPELAHDIEAWVGSYLLDVPDFRSEEKARILRDIYTLCDQRFTLARKLLERDDPDMLMLVDMGVDRLHHAFWKQMDHRHPHYVSGSPFSDAIHDYYLHIDQQIGTLISYCNEQTVVLVVSDHGARPLEGGVRVNEWLQSAGYLHLHQRPAYPGPLEAAHVDWPRTRAWGAGGYYGRIFLNVQGREPEGCIAPAAYDRERNELAARLKAMPGPDGQPLGNTVFLPQQIYRNVRGIAPDIILYLGDLAWRALGTVGGDTLLYTTENDTGPDDANHAQYGLYILCDPQRPANTVEQIQIYDVLPTLLARFAITPPARLQGRVV